MKNDYLATRSGKQAWTYYASNSNTDEMPPEFESTQSGNERYVAQHKDGYRRYIRYSNAKAPGQTYLDSSIGFPTVPWGEIRSEEDVNRRAVEQGFITVADWDYYYESSK